MPTNSSSVEGSPVAGVRAGAGAGAGAGGGVGSGVDAGGGVGSSVGSGGDTGVDSGGDTGVGSGKLAKPVIGNTKKTSIAASNKLMTFFFIVSLLR